MAQVENWDQAKSELRDAIEKLGYMSGEEFDNLVKPEDMLSPRKES